MGLQRGDRVFFAGVAIAFDLHTLIIIFIIIKTISEKILIFILIFIGIESRCELP